MKARKGPEAALESLLGGDLVGDQRLHADVVGPLQRRAKAVRKSARETMTALDRGAAERGA
jgi:hypothetical protein